SVQLSMTDAKCSRGSLSRRMKDAPSPLIIIPESSSFTRSCTTRSGLLPRLIPRLSATSDTPPVEMLHRQATRDPSERWLRLTVYVAARFGPAFEHPIAFVSRRRHKVNINPARVPTRYAGSLYRFFPICRRTNVDVACFRDLFTFKEQC